MENKNIFSNEFLDFLKKIGFSEFTEAQENFIPVISEGKDAILISPTGSGKTEAAIFPIMDMIVRESPAPITCLFITPLRALNRDMLGRLRKYGSFASSSSMISPHRMTPLETFPIQCPYLPILCTSLLICLGELN